VTGSLQILVLALPLHLASGHFRIALVASGHQRRDLGLVTAGAMVHVASKLLLIPFFGNSGAAWGTFAGEAVLMLMAWRTANSAFRS
jgi:O-antigen/teichoic acid export membrane protein